MDCNTQQSRTMLLRKFCKYYSEQPKDVQEKKILNVISLEISHTPLAPLVEPPSLVSRVCVCLCGGHVTVM